MIHNIGAAFTVLWSLCGMLAGKFYMLKLFDKCNHCSLQGKP